MENENIITGIIRVLIKNPQYSKKLLEILRIESGGVFNQPCEQPSISIFDATQTLLEAKGAANKSPRYVKALGGYLNQFMRGREQMPINEFRVETLDKWFANRTEMPASYGGSDC